MRTLIKLISAVAATTAEALSALLRALGVAAWYAVFLLYHWREVITAILSQDWRFLAMLGVIVALGALGHVPYGT
jgi:hypothetical protein